MIVVWCIWKECNAYIVQQQGAFDHYVEGSFFAQEVKLHLYLLPQPLHPQMMNWLSSSSAPSIALVITGIFSS